MSSSLLALASMLHVAAAPMPSTLAVSGAAQAGSASARCGCPSIAALDESRIRAGIDELMRGEGIPPTPALIGIRPVELDGEARTQEAFVDIVAPTLCFSGGCPTLVVQQSVAGDIGTVGRGVALYKLTTRTGGWADLTNSALFSSPARTMHWVGGRFAGRYQ